MALKTIREQLEEVQTAISALMTSQEYKLPDGRTLRRVDLEALQKREDALLKRAETSGLDTIPGSTVTKGAFRVSFTE